MEKKEYYSLLSNEVNLLNNQRIYLFENIETKEKQIIEVSANSPEDENYVLGGIHKYVNGQMIYDEKKTIERKDAIQSKFDRLLKKKPLH